jgi:hypothetical protein
MMTATRTVTNWPIDVGLGAAYWGRVLARLRRIRRFTSIPRTSKFQDRTPMLLSDDPVLLVGSQSIGFHPLEV